MRTCSTLSREFAEPVDGTAATAATWLLIEQSGPWGSRALTQSRLDPVLGGYLERATEGSGVRVALIRRPGRHPGASGPARRRVFAAHTLPGRSWVRSIELTDPRELRDLDFPALGAGRHHGLGDAYRGDPLVCVCTNGTRDRCCAVLARPLVGELAAAGTPGLWESTHLGGHRFAPTLLVLPYGYAYGRIGATEVTDVLGAVRNGRVRTHGCRGRSAFDRPAQAAELAVRRSCAETAADALTVQHTEGTGPRWTVTVAHRDGRSWRAEVLDDASGPPLPASCGAGPSPQSRMTVTRLVPVPHPAAGR